MTFTTSLYVHNTNLINATHHYFNLLHHFKHFLAENIIICYVVLYFKPTTFPQYAQEHHYNVKVL